MALEGILSNVGGEILKKLGFQALECLGMLWGLNDDLHKLRSNVSSIQAVLRDAEQRQIKGDYSVKGWLERLGDVLYNIEDALDEISTEALRREVMTRGKNAKQVRIFFSNSNQLAFNYRVGCQVKKINESLDVICEEKNKFHFNVNAELRISNALSRPIEMGRETHSSSSGEKVIGSDDDMSYLKHLLLAEDDTNAKANVSFIAIVGMGGIDKTTLAKALYNDKHVSDCFNPRIWIWVSDQFDTNTILKKTIESATGQNPKVEGREALNIMLQKVIEKKKYLLVMDDVWNETENEWENLKNLLMLGARGSKVLIPKRDTKEVAEVKIVSLKDLPEDRSWWLFKEVAFKESDLESTNKNLIQLGKEISEKCGGIPLVTRHIGRLLYGKTSVQDWAFIKDNELLNVTHDQNNNDDHVISTLKLSYNYLPPNLKQCFAYTSLFPKGCIISSDGGKSMEDMGKDYLNELCWRFFYEISSDDIVSMHDVMRDHAREVAGKKLYVRGDPKNEYVVSEQTRHISFDYKIKSWRDILSKLRPAKGLRTFLLFNSYDKSIVHSYKVSQVEEIVLNRLFSNFQRLRVLDFRNSRILKVTESKKKLKHLRYLDLSRNVRIEPLPNSIKKLQNLQTLNVTGCYKLKELPRDITSNLVNLRHIAFDPLNQAIQMPRGMEKLRCLQTLSLFVLDCRNFNKLREFNELKCFVEDLRIIGLEQLRCSTPSEVRLVNLKDKRGFLYLTLEWKLRTDENEGEGEHERVMEGLEPHTSVEHLSIRGYCGVKIAQMGVQDLEFEVLSTIEITNCHRLQHLTQLSHHQALKSLLLKGLTSLMSMSEWIGTITSLETLSIMKCPKLKLLQEEMRQLNCLKFVCIVDSPQLDERCKEGGED